MNDVPKTKGHLKRQATEAAIVDAFDRLMHRHGPRGIGVNAVVKEAGVGKGLIYKYFGGLPGIVKAWGEKNKLWPSTTELMGASDEAFSGLDAAGQIKTLVINHLNALRRNSIGTDLMADELMAPSEISEALTGARQKLGRECQAIFAQNHAMRDYDNYSMLVVALAAANYMAMRAARAPRFMGDDLASDEGWNAMLARIERVIDIAIGDERMTPAAQPASAKAVSKPVKN